MGPVDACGDWEMILNSTSTTRRALASLSVVSLLGFVLLTILAPPAAQYEISIYQSFPWYYWMLTICSILFGTLTVLASAFDSRESYWDHPDNDVDDQLWVVGAVTIILTSVGLMLMPFIRGYSMYGRADPMTHLGYTRIIAETGVAGGGNIYPNAHLLIQIFTYATGNEMMSVVGLIPPIVTLLYFGSMILLLQHVFESRARILIGMPLALLPVYNIAHLGISPFRLSVLFVPFVLYLFVKEQRTGSIAVRAVLAVSLLALVIYHPLTAIFMLLVFLARYVVVRARRVEVDQAKPTNIASLLSVFFAAWYLNFAGIIFRFEGIVEAFLIDDSDAPIDSYSATVSSTSPDLVDLVRIAMFKYGFDGLLVAIGVLFLAVSLYLWWREKYEPDVFTVVFGISLLGFATGSATFLLFDLIVGMNRPLMFAKLFAILIGGGTVYLAWQSGVIPGRIPDIGVDVSLVVVLLIIISLMTFTLYWSPLSSRINQQVTEMELEGSEWVFENRNPDQEIEEFGIRQYRFHDAMYGVDNRDEVRRSDTYPPDHFNYTSRQFYGMNYERDNYLIISRLGRITYPSKFPQYEEFWRFTPQDFDRLEKDRTVNRLYDNGDFTTYGVDAIPPEATEDPTQSISAHRHVGYV